MGKSLWSTPVEGIARVGIKHTAGPWRYSKAHNDIISMAPGVKSDVVAEYVLGVSLANARLIAAAPELLEALEELIAATQHLDQCHQATADKARAAIAKAKGEEQ